MKIDRFLKLSLAFQKANFPSFAQVIKVLLSKENVIDVTNAEWPFRWATSERITKSQTFIWQSSAEEISRSVSFSGKNSKLVIIPRWPPVKLCV